eukprot:761837-Hanusia_phi.AAC.13
MFLLLAAQVSSIHNISYPLVCFCVLLALQPPVSLLPLFPLSAPPPQVTPTAAEALKPSVPAVCQQLEPSAVGIISPNDHPLPPGRRISSHSPSPHAPSCPPWSFHSHVYAGAWYRGTTRLCGGL